MRRIPLSWRFLLLPLVFLAGACLGMDTRSATDTPTLITTPPSWTGTPAKPASATLTPTPSPFSNPSPSPTPQTLVGPVFSFQGIGFTVDPILGTHMFVSSGSDWFGGVNFSFSPEDHYREGCVAVYPVKQFRKLSLGEYIIDALAPAIEAGSNDYFPSIGAAILLRAQTQHLRFDNGAGIRAIVVRGQNGFYASNEQLEYKFYGLTDDGRFFIEVSYPIDAPIMMSTSDPEENTNPEAVLAPPVDRNSADWVPNMLAYNHEVERLLEELDDTSFTPALGVLDGLVESLQIAYETGE